MTYFYLVQIGEIVRFNLLALSEFETISDEDIDSEIC